MGMSDIEEFRKEIERIPVLDDIGIFGSEEDKDKRRKRIEHESDHNIGEIVKKLKIPIARDNLFMDDITREELR